MAIVRLTKAGDSATPQTIETEALYPYKPSGNQDTWIVKRISEGRDGYNIFGLKGTNTTEVLLGRVPYGEFIETHN